jgi:hypothetical protein
MMGSSELRTGPRALEVQEEAMTQKDRLTQLLALVGTALVWLPIVAPLLFGLFTLGAGRQFRVDYLMPAELFPVAFVGGGLLAWAAARAHAHRRLIAWGLGLAMGLLFASQALAVATGLASGEIAPAGWPLALVLSMLAAYVLALMAVGVGGALLLREMFDGSGPRARML